MYKKIGAQLSVYDYVRPFEGMLDQSNRWVRLAQELDWQQMEEQYSKQFSKRGGNVALPVRMAFGSLVIRKALNLTDEETVRQISENLYMQYFVGLTSFTSRPPFSPSSMKVFRRRIPDQAVAQAALRLRQLSKKNKDAAQGM